MDRQQNLKALDRKLVSLSRRRKRLQEKLENIYGLRLTFGTIFFVFLIVVALNFWVQPILIAQTALILAFSYAVMISRRLEEHLTQIDHLQDFYKRILARLDFQALEVKVPEENKKWLDHPLSHDLDLLGPSSLLNMLDESIHARGQAHLIESMINPDLTENDLKDRHNQVKTLSARSGVLRKYIRESKEDPTKGAFGISELLNDSFIFPKFHQVHMRLWILCFAFWSAAILASTLKVNTHWGLIWLAYFTYSVYTLRKVEKIFSRLQNIIVRLDSLYAVFSIIEQVAKFPDFKKHLKEFQDSPCAAIRKFETSFAFLSVQTHPVILFVINGLVPWNYFFVSQAEKGRVALNERSKGIFEEFAWFDTISSLSLFHRYLSKTFPVAGEVLEIKNARHPLIAAAKNVSNTFSWPKGKNLCLITGSNMAGKSTFLRTVGANFVLARMGAPVFVDQMTFPLMPLKTCIRVSDSVREGFSYFYAETLRVAEILAAAKKGPILYLVDEVFKGTNNRERYVGGRALLEELAKTKANGFVTTHDLELSKLDNPVIANFHFKDEIRNNQMHFSYKIEAGPCPTTNALKIMALAGIPVATES